VLLDAPALLRRLSAKWQGKALLDAFVRRYQGRRRDGLTHVLAFVDRSAAATWVAEKLRRPRRPDDNTPSPESVMQSWLTATGDLPRLCELACVHPRGPRLSPEKLLAALASAGALLPPDLRQRVEQCRNTTRSLRSVVSGLGRLMIVMYFRHHLVVRAIDPGELEAALARVFPERAAELLAVARTEGKKHEELFASMCVKREEAKRFLEALEPFQDVGDLAALRSAEELSTSRRKQLAAFAYVLRGLFRGDRPPAPGPRAPGDELFAACLAGKDVKAARLRIVLAGSGGRRPTLTEDAWEWILREDDPRLVGFLVRLFSSTPLSDEGRELKLALLSSRVLSEATASMMEDDALMKEAEALVEEQRRRDGHPAAVA
jgi:hypothetical protein